VLTETSLRENTPDLSSFSSFKRDFHCLSEHLQGETPKLVSEVQTFAGI
jgi:hypothetical protein